MCVCVCVCARALTSYSFIGLCMDIVVSQSLMKSRPTVKFGSSLLLEHFRRESNHLLG